MTTEYSNGGGGGGFRPSISTNNYFTDEGYFAFLLFQQGSSGTGGGGGAATPPSPPSPASLLESAKARLAAALNKKDGAKDFKNVANVLKKLQTVGFSNQGIIRFVTVNGIEEPADGSPGVARYNPFGRSVNLNSSVNWTDPSKIVKLLDGKLGTSDQLIATAFSLGVTDVSAAQFMDLSILHVLSHYSGALGNPDSDPTVEKNLWADCIK
jgi:hypothetical protein